MPLPKPTKERVAEAIATVKRCGSKSEAARELNIPISTLKGWLANADYKPSHKPAEKKFTAEESGNSRFIESVDDKVKTLDDALAKGAVDTAIWEVERFTVNSWEVGTKNRETGVVTVTPLWQVKVWLRRRVSKVQQQAFDLLMERIAAKAKPFKYPKLEIPTDPHLLEISLFDAHFGKLAWERETGNTYDLKTAQRLYLDAVTELLRKAAPFNVDQIVFPIGSDFFHIDNLTNSTTAGTPQDVDTRLAKIVDAGVAAIQQAIEMCAERAPVKILHVPGNHDRLTSWFMARELKAYYSRNERIDVDVEPKSRKYFAYGRTLIGFTHGDEEKHDSLPLIMAGGEKEMWFNSDYREWHLGHFHKSKETKYLSSDTFGPVRVRILPSLSGTDKWHYAKGYVGGHQSAEAYLYSKARGLAAVFHAYAKE